jgi:hypothetical protein
MTPQFEIAIVSTGQSLPLGDAPLTIGRAPGNDLILSDDTISWHHAQLWLEGGVPWLRDVGSRNGTFVNDNRCLGSTRLSDGDKVRLGPLLELVVRGAFGAPSARFRSRHLVDEEAGLRLTISSDRFRIGSAAGSDLRLPDGPPRAATILLHDNGEIWVGTAEGDWQVEAGAVFEVAGRRLRVVEEGVDHAPTVDFGASNYAYRLRVGTGTHGPHAVLYDVAGGRELLITGNRGVLLFVLGSKLAEHRAEALPPTEEGWIATNDVLVGVWGRGQATSNHLNVLVHRTRQHLEEEGFDPWCIEKRRGAVRIRARAVEVV